MDFILVLPCQQRVFVSNRPSLSLPFSLAEWACVCLPRVFPGAVRDCVSARAVLLEDAACMLRGSAVDM